MITGGISVYSGKYFHRNCDIINDDREKITHVTANIFTKMIKLSIITR